MSKALLTFFSALIGLAHIIVWNVLIYMIIENFRGHEHYSYIYLGLITVGCISITKIYSNMERLLPKEDETEV